MSLQLCARTAASCRMSQAIKSWQDHGGAAEHAGRLIKQCTQWLPRALLAGAKRGHQREEDVLFAWGIPSWRSTLPWLRSQYSKVKSLKGGMAVGRIFLVSPLDRLRLPSPPNRPDDQGEDFRRCSFRAAHHFQWQTGWSQAAA